jgi:hypothetical protein
MSRDFPSFHIPLVKPNCRTTLRFLIIRPIILRLRLPLSTLKQICINIDKNNNANNTAKDHSTTINGTPDRHTRTDMLVIPPCSSMRIKCPTALKLYTTSKSSPWDLEQIVRNAWPVPPDMLDTGFDGGTAAMIW